MLPILRYRPVSQKDICCFAALSFKKSAAARPQDPSLLADNYKKCIPQYVSFLMGSVVGCVEHGHMSPRVNQGPSITLSASFSIDMQPKNTCGDPPISVSVKTLIIYHCYLIESP